MTVLLGSSIAEILTMLFGLVDAYALYYKRPNHVWTPFLVGIIIACVGCVSLFHSCAAPDIAWCPQDLDTQLALDTITTFLMVAATFAPFFPGASDWVISMYMSFMLIFCIIMQQVFGDEFWSILVVVPVASIPFWYYGQAQEVALHPTKHILHYLSCLVGLFAVYCKWTAGTDVTTDAYQNWHPSWHAASLLCSFLYVLDQARIVLDSDTNKVKYQKVSTWPSSSSSTSKI
jgi:hypothetical protein